MYLIIRSVLIRIQICILFQFYRSWYWPEKVPNNIDTIKLTGVLHLCFLQWSIDHEIIIPVSGSASWYYDPENTEYILQISKMSGSLSGVVSKFYTEYTVNTPKKLKVIDAYLTYVFFTGVIQVTAVYIHFFFCASVLNVRLSLYLSCCVAIWSASTLTLVLLGGGGHMSLLSPYHKNRIYLKTLT